MVEIECCLSPGAPTWMRTRADKSLPSRNCRSPAHVSEKVGAYPSPTINVDGEDVMGSPPFSEAACRLDTADP